MSTRRPPPSCATGLAGVHTSVPLLQRVRNVARWCRCCWHHRRYCWSLHRWRPWRASRHCTTCSPAALRCVLPCSDTSALLRQVTSLDVGSDRARMTFTAPTPSQWPLLVQSATGAADVTHVNLTSVVIPRYTPGIVGPMWSLNDASLLSLDADSIADAASAAAAAAGGEGGGGGGGGAGPGGMPPGAPAASDFPVGYRVTCVVWAQEVAMLAVGCSDGAVRCCRLELDGFTPWGSVFDGDDEQESLTPGVAVVGTLTKLLGKGVTPSCLGVSPHPLQAADDAAGGKDPVVHVPLNSIVAGAPRKQPGRRRPATLTPGTRAVTPGSTPAGSRPSSSATGASAASAPRDAPLIAISRIPTEASASAAGGVDSKATRGGRRALSSTMPPSQQGGGGGGGGGGRLPGSAAARTMSSRGLSTASLSRRDAAASTDSMRSASGDELPSGWCFFVGGSDGSVAVLSATADGATSCVLLSAASFVWCDCCGWCFCHWCRRAVLLPVVSPFLLLTSTCGIVCGWCHCCRCRRDEGRR
jgi:hypothetical protein